MISIDKDKELLIRELGIFELRGLARQLGVSSPTTKKRDELIDCILSAMQSSEVQENPTKRKGRPFKKLSSIKDILNSVSEETAPYEALTYNSMLSFAQVAAEFDNFNDDTYQNLVGYARVNDGKVTFIDCDKNVWVFVGDEVESAKLVKNGDKLVVKACSTNVKNQYYGIEILEINGIAIKNYKPEIHTYGFEVISNNTLPFGDKQIKEGRRNSVCLLEDLYENDNFKNVYKYCNAKNINFVVLGTNVSFEDTIYFNSFDNMVDFTTKYGTGDIVNINKVIDGINFVNRKIELGESVFLVLTDVMETIRAIDRALDNQLENKQEMKKIIVTELLSLAKSFEKGPVCTTLVCYRKNDYDNSYLQNEILRICKNI